MKQNSEAVVMGMLLSVQYTAVVPQQWAIALYFICNVYPNIW